MHAVTRKQQVQALEIGTVGVACERDGRRLVEALHAPLDLGAGDERRALQCEAEHLEVGNVVSPSELGRRCRQLTCALGVSRRVRDESLLKREPPVRRARLERVEVAMCAPEPAACDRRRRRGSRARRPPARWPCAPRSPRRRARGRAGTRARGPRRPSSRRRATTPPSSVLPSSPPSPHRRARP